MADKTKREENICSSSRVLTSFARETTFHGLRYLTTWGEYRIRRLIWAFACLGMVSLLVYIATSELQNYSEYPTRTKISQRQTRSLEFPAVTVCNLNMILANKSDIPDELFNYFNVWNGLRPLDSVNLTHTYFSESYIDAASMVELSQTVDELLFKCLWQGKEINCSDYFTRRLSDLGVCYTFNDYTTVNERGYVMSSSVAGSFSGLSLILTVEQDSHMFGRSLAAGVKVILHGPYEEPDTLSLGFTASPGFQTNVNVRAIKHVYRPHPYKSYGDAYCQDIQAIGRGNLKYYSYYSRHACYTECKDRYITEKCNCTTWVFEQMSQAQPCNLAEALTCFKFHESEFLLNADIQSTCDCPLPCTFTEYNAQLSMAYYPAHYLQSHLNIGSSYRLNSLMVNVYYDSLTYEQQEDHPVYQIETILANLGGQLGLFIGASVLSILEVGDFIALQIYLAMKKASIRRVSHD